ncbi:DUF342 domain-containing protein [Breznakiella homolactica]|uniref:DUF342 domain-containing protein n=1 Tax=Breznakiella homolactica TaxID=2798577 RepID=A0A7T7XLQ0_9SPIR|nr:FapA family protein [Breznakiella homolactica]QQO08592.1 FapA family protein [Breznakiella homolactica]
MEEQKEKAPGAREQVSEKPQKTALFDLHKNDGTLVITFSEKNLEAWGDFIPPVGKGHPLTADYVSAALSRFNVTYGVRWENIQDALEAVQNSGKPVKHILIAQGEPPEDEVPEYFRLDPELRRTTLPGEDVIRVDYKTISPYVMVKKDQLLASKYPKVEGHDGRDVHGTVIPKGIIRMNTASSGKNTRCEDEGIYASIDGRLIDKDGELMVDEVLVIKGQVGYATGHISFPGDVIIEGPVADGFKILSGGSVLVKQTFDVTDLVAKKDLIVTGGIIGRGRALVKTGGGLKAKFIRNCRVACRSTITIESEIVNSSVFTMQNLNLGDKGRILSGEIYAVHGIKAAMIGKQSGKTTKIHCGIDFTAQQEKDKLNLRLRILTAKLQKLRELMEKNSGDPAKVAKMEELAERLQDEIGKLSTRIGDLLLRLNADENAAVEVSGEIARGTLIEICGIAYYVDQSLKRVRFRLDKAQGKLVYEPLK